MKKNSRANILKGNIFIFALGNVLVKLISLLLMPLYTSYLTTEQYSVAELLNNFTEIVIPIVTLCVVDAVYRFSIDDDVDYASVFTNAVKVLTCGYLVLSVLSTVFYYLTGYSYTFYFLLLYIAASAQKLCSQFSRGIGDVKIFAFSGVLNAMVLVASNLLLIVLLHKGTEAYLLSLIIAHLCSSVFCFITSKEYNYFDIKRLDKHLLKDMLIFSVPNVPNMLSWWANNLSNRYIILCFMGDGAAGLFTAASKLPAVINTMAAIFQQAWQYSTAKELKAKDSEAFFSGVFKYYICFIILMCSVIILFMPYVSYLLLRGDFYKAWRYVPLLLVSAAIGCVSTFFGTFYTAAKENKMAMYTTMCGAAVNVATNILLINSYGISGTLIAGLFGITVIAVMRIIDTSRYTHIKCNYLSITIQFSVLVIQAVTYLFDVERAIYFQIVCVLALMLINYSTLVCIIKILYITSLNFIKNKMELIR